MHGQLFVSQKLFGVFPLIFGTRGGVGRHSNLREELTLILILVTEFSAFCHRKIHYRFKKSRQSFLIPSHMNSVHALAA